MKRTLTAGVIMLVVGGSVTVWLRASQPETTAEIRAVRAVTGNLVTAVTAVGAVQPKRTIDIKYDGQEVVEEVLVYPGDHVEAGQVLARMSTEMLSLARKQADQLAARDEVSLNHLAATLKRAEALWERGLIPRGEFDSAVASVEQARLQRAASDEGRKLTDVQIADATLRSPISGVVTQLYVQAGERLGSASAVAAAAGTAAGKPTNVLMTLMQDGALEIWADVNAMDIGRLSIGDDVEAMVDALGGSLMHGRISNIAMQPTVIGNVTAYQVTISLPRPDPRLRIGLPASVMFPTVVATRAVLLPIAAVTGDQKDAQCLVAAADGSIESRRVEVIGRNAQAVAVRGVQEGDTVLLASPETGRPIMPRLETFATNPSLSDLRSSSTGQPTAAPPPARPRRSLMQRVFGVQP
jgi:HlyD family secretion protein